MAKVQATELRPGMVVEVGGEPCRVLQFTHRTPGKGNAVVQAKLRSLRSGIQSETRFGSTEQIERVSVTNRAMDYLYRDGDGYVFMDAETYEQTLLGSDVLARQAPWLNENMRVSVQYIGEEPGGVELPKTVEVEVAETDPPLKGATASASPKAATLANGVVIKVPQFVESGELIRVDPEQCRYIERAR